MEELTTGQRLPLFKLVRYQRESKQEIIFSVGQGWELEIKSWEKRTTEETPIIKIPKEIFELWRECNYIAISERGLGGGSLAYSVQTFVLKKESLDYESFMQKPKLIQGIIKLWQSLIEDVPSLVWGIVGGVGSAVITIIVLKWLGINP